MVGASFYWLFSTAGGGAHAPPGSDETGLPSLRPWGLRPIFF